MRCHAPRTPAPVQAKADSSRLFAPARRLGAEQRRERERPAALPAGPGAGFSLADVPVHAPPARAPDPAGIPEPLKAGVERLSGLAMDDVRVHRDSPEPARLDALAFARGSDIHLGPGQEQHLPHEAWHVVQQKQGRVRATTQMKGMVVNADPRLEAEADLMAPRATLAAPAPVALEERQVAIPAIQAQKAPAAKGLDYHAMEVVVSGNNNSGLSDELIIAQAYKESRFKPGAKNPTSSATGLLGITKVAVKEVNRIHKTSHSHASMTDAGTNVQVGTLYLAICLGRKGSTAAALDYYGTGPGYSTNILAAETALQANPPDPMAALATIIGK